MYHGRIRVPEQVSVMGYNDGPLAEKMILEPHYGCKVMTGTALIERASVKNRNKK